MRPISDNTVIQIETTNDCYLSCSNCTRHVGNHAVPVYMTLDQIRHAVECTLDAPTRIGLMGGEPTVHPDFAAICGLWQELVPMDRREFWTSGFRWGQYKDLIKETFLPDRIHYNDHRSYDGKHQPLLIALDDVIDDEELKRQLIENCPFQSHWSASVTVDGAYFCEIGASLDRLLNGGANAWPIEPGWWKRGVADFTDQVGALCGSCSGALPLPAYPDARGGRDKPNRDVVSPSNLARLKAVGSPKIERGDYELWERKLSAAEIEALRQGWQPRQFRPFVAHNPEDVTRALRSVP